MLKRIFSKLFNTAEKSSQDNSLAKVPTTVHKSHSEIVEYYKEEIINSPFVKESGREAVLRDFLHETKLKGGELLSLEEKRSHGINTKLKITRELFEVLTPEGLEYGPKKALRQLYIKANFNHNMHSHVERMKMSGITQYTPMSCGDGRDCEWCTSIDGKKISITVDFVQLVKEHCTCDCCGCVIKANLDF